MVKPLDMTELLIDAYQLADEINESEEVKNYLRLKKAMQEDAQVQKLIQNFQKIKMEYEEAQRFGIFHPDYHQAKQRAEEFQRKMTEHPLIAAYLEAESKLDQLLYEISTAIAHSVSESIKIPSNSEYHLKKCTKQNSQLGK